MTPDAATDADELLDLDPYEFEVAVADLWRQRGYDTEVRPQSRDNGVDVVARREDPHPEKVVIQAKRNAPGNKVSSPEIQQYASLRRQENADSVVVVTTSDFTADARDRARDLNVKLIDGTRLRSMVETEERSSSAPAPTQEYANTDEGSGSWGLGSIVIGAVVVVGSAIAWGLRNFDLVIELLVRALIVLVFLYAFLRVLGTVAGPVPFL